LEVTVKPLILAILEGSLHSVAKHMHLLEPTTKFN